MQNSHKNGTPKRFLNHRERVLKEKFYEVPRHTESDDEIVPPKQDGKIHIKWAEELTEIKTFKKLPSDKRIQSLKEKARNTSKVVGKSILKVTKNEYKHCSSDTEASSMSSEAEVRHQNRRKAVRSEHSRKSASVTKPTKKPIKATQRYPNSHHLEELLMARVYRKYRIPPAVTLY